MSSFLSRYGKLLRVVLLAAAFVGWLGLFVYKVHYLKHGGHQIDDSYMFYRYAQHLRQGLGFSWNMDGIHTYGMTTLLWAWIIVPFSMLPLQSAISLTLASWLSSGLALYLISAAIWKNADSPLLRDKGIVLGLVTLTLLIVPMFCFGNVSGMETMFAFAMLAALIGLVLEQDRRDVCPELIGGVAFLLFLSRPESLLPTGLLLALSPWMVRHATVPRILRSFGVLFAAVALYLLGGKLYFGAPLPLSFYLKAKNGYVGYRARWYPFTYALTAMKTSALYALAIVLLASRRTLKLLVLTLIPLVAIAGYLCTVTQIMGFHDRYYLPYLPLLAIPAFLLLDKRLARPATEPSTPIPPANWVGTLVVIAFALGAFPYKLQVLVERHTEPRVLSYQNVWYPAPTVPAPRVEYFTAINAFSEQVAPFVPAGTIIASTEVGYLGVTAPQANILDLAGLNDRDIALNGFAPDAFLARAPDVIWMPHDDYTYQRGILLTDPAFLAKYEFYAGAMNYGLAIRKDSPAKAIVEQHLAAVWPKLYPGTTPSQAFVQAVEWPAGTIIPGVSPPKY